MKRVLQLFLIFLISGAAFSQQARVSGTIKNGDGNPLEGASVTVKGTTTSAVTDAQGRFAINASNGSTLVISSVGFGSREVRVTGAEISIALTAEDKAMGEVVVVGYGTTRRRDVNSAISSVRAKEIKDFPVAGFDQAIAGKVAGVRVSTGNGAPGAGQTIIIRGTGSINASSTPLYVIDGMPYPDSYDRNENPLNSINIGDIEAIEVLKDASATAIYGARASNGVIIVTTRRGRSGKPVISFNSYAGLQQIGRNIPMANAAEFKQYLRDSKSQSYVLQDPFLWDDARRSYSWNTPNDVRLANLRARNSEGINGDRRIERWFVLSDTIANDADDVDWVDEITRNAMVQDYQLSASGGTENVSYMISGNYFNQNGIVKASGYKRYGARANVDIRPSTRFKFGMNIAPSYEVFNRLEGMEGNDGPNGLFGRALVMPPIFAPFDASGAPAYLGGIPNGPYDFDLATQINPHRYFDIQSKATNMRIISSVYVELKFLNDFTFRSELHTEIRNRIGDFYSPSSFPTTSTPTSRSVGINERLNRVYLNSMNYLTYAKRFNNHSVTMVGGYQAEKTSINTNYIRKAGFFVDNIATLNNSSTIDNVLNDARSNGSTSTFIGIFGRLNYNFNDRYYLTASIRRDGSSKFGAENRWGNFPAVSVAWRLSEEPFMKWVTSYVNDWKIRAGWGKTGNSSIGDYLALNRLGYSDYTLGGTSLVIGTQDASIPFTKLGWEATRDINIGTDISFLKGRINFEYNYYHRKTTDMLYSVALMASTGFTSQLRNIASMENKGMEFAVNTRNTVGELKWNTGFNLYFNRNKVLDLGPQKNPLFGIDTRTEEGKPISNIYGLLYLGPYRDWEDVKNSPIVVTGNGQIFRSLPGDAKFADINGDGVIDEAGDRTILGNPQPDFVWGLTNTLSYKKFDMAVQVNGVQGGDINIRTFRRDGVFGGNGGRTNVPKFYYDNYWRPDRTDAKYEAPNRKAYAKLFATSSQNVEKGTFVNIANITFGYTLPTALLERAKVSNLRFYLSVQNAYMFSKYHGFNPEANVGGADPRTQGVDETGYPITRTFSFGVNLSF